MFFICSNFLNLKNIYLKIKVTTFKSIQQMIVTDQIVEIIPYS